MSQAEDTQDRSGGACTTPAHQQTVWVAYLAAHPQTDWRAIYRAAVEYVERCTIAPEAIDELRWIFGISAADVERFLLDVGIALRRS